MKSNMYVTCQDSDRQSTAMSNSTKPRVDDEEDVDDLDGQKPTMSPLYKFAHKC